MAEQLPLFPPYSATVRTFRPGPPIPPWTWEEKECDDEDEGRTDP